MITGIEMESFRGIGKGRLDGLEGLTILTGPNGCGKSAILDALLIGVSRTPGEAVKRAVERHPVSKDGARWLITIGAQKANIVVREDTSESRIGLEWRRITKSNVEKLGPPPLSRIGLAHSALPPGTWAIDFSIDNQSEGSTADLPRASSRGDVTLIDPALPEPLATIYSRAVKKGHKAEVQSLLQSLIADFYSLDVLAEDDGTPVLYVVHTGKAVPVSLSGDGIQGYLQLGLGLAASSDGLVLVEEPEVCQHHRAIWQSAKAILAAVRRGVQVVMTTHSLELIDAIVDEANEEDRERLALFNLLLEQGELKVSRIPGQDVAYARQELEKDLR